MKTERTIYLVRHGETAYNTGHIVQGWSNSPLTDIGRHQAAETGKELAQTPFALLYTGGLGRQEETAALIVRENRYADMIRRETDERLRELYYGSFEEQPESVMLTAAARTEQRPLRTFSEMLENHTLGGIADLVAESDPARKAERSEDALGRFTRALRDIDGRMETMQARNALVITSGGVMGILLENIDRRHRFCPVIKNGNILCVSIAGDSICMVKYYDEGMWKD